MKHTLAEMGQRWARCSCGWTSTCTAEEFVDLRASQLNDLLIDRHAAHVAAKRDAGK